MNKQDKKMFTKKENSTVFNPMLNRLDCLLTNFEENSANFPPLKLPSTQKRKSRKTKKSPKHLRHSETPAPIQNHRHTPQSTPEPFHAPFFQSYESNIGPGSYKPQSFCIAGGKLLQAPRFVMSPIEKAEQFVNFKSKLNQELPIITKNKDLQEFSMEKKLERLEKNKKIKEFEIEVHKNAKKSLEESNHKAKLDNYLKKINGIEWKLRKHERKFMKPRWTVLMLDLSIATAIKYKILQRKHFKKQAFKCFSLTVMVSRFIGKLKRKIYNIRLRKLRTIIKRNTNKMRLWLRNRKKTYFSCILQILDNFSMSTMMTKIMSNFMSKILRVQRALRSMICIKYYRFKSIHRLFIKNSSKILRRSNTKNPKIVFRHYDIAESEISKYFRFCFEKYNKIYKVYKKELNEYISNKNETLSNDPNFKDFDPVPQKPSLILYSNFIENFESFLQTLIKRSHKKSK